MTLTRPLSLTKSPLYPPQSHKKLHQLKIHHLPLALPLPHLSQSSPPSSNDTPSPQLSNPFLDDIMDVPPRPSNPIPLQSHPYLDITLSLSPITPLDHILDTPLPQPPPQPPLMGHPIYFNTFDYHGVNCLCCFYNRNLIFTLRDEMNLMFAHLDYLLTSAIASPSPPHP
ncbi:hypothetical protein Tco_1561425 [Tanacetum coccineum]